MTAAVCIRCGRMKLGAFATCPACQFTPEEPEELAKSVLLSNQVADPTALAEASAQLQAGAEVTFDPRAVAQWVKAIRAGPTTLQMPLGLRSQYARHRPVALTFAWSRC